MDPINLDGMTASELDKLSSAYQQLATYARLKARAMRHREAGRIVAAQSAEWQCERIYAALPECLRW